MKHLYTNFVQSYLRFCLRVLFFKHNPIIIAITGTANCQVVKDRLNNFLKNKIKIRVTPPGANDQLGVPLGILDLERGTGKTIKWFWILTDAISIAFFSAKFPQVIIADLAISQVGEMDYFLKLLKPRVAVLTKIGGKFSPEYLKLADGISEAGLVLFNQDDENQKEVGFLNTHVKYYHLDKPGELEKIVGDYILGKFVY